VSGEKSGQYAAGDDDALCPWTVDDLETNQPADVGTRARIQLDLFDLHPQTH
jgi:hypothetical protein